MSLGLKIQLENKDAARAEYLNFVKELNNQKISLGINFNNNTMGDIQKELDKLKQQFNDTEFTPKINNREFKSGIANQIGELKKFTGSIEQIKKELSSLGEVKIKSNAIDDGGVRTFIASVKEASGKVTELNYAMTKGVGDKFSYKFEGFKSITDSTDKVIKNLDKFKTEYQNKINSLKNIGLVEDNSINKFEKQLNNLNTNNFKSSINEIKNSFKELETESNNFAKVKQELEKNTERQTQQELKEVEQVSQQEIKDRQKIQESINATIKAREKENKVLEQNQFNAINKNMNEEYNQVQKFVEKSTVQLEKLREKFQNVASESDIGVFKNKLSALSNSSNFKDDSADITSQLNQYKTHLEEQQRIVSLGDNVGSFKSTGLDMSSDINDIKKFAQENINAKASITSITESEDRFGNSVKTANVSVNEGNNIVSKYKVALDEASGSTYKASAGVQDLSSKQKSFRDTLKSAMESVTGFSLISGAYFTTLSAMKDMIVYTGQMDNALTDLNKVVDMNKSSLDNMRNSSLDLGQELGKDSVEIMNSMAEAGRQFKDIDDIKTFAETATMASNVTDMSAQQAAKSLTTVMKVFKQNIGDVRGDLDSFNEIQNNYRVSGEDLAHSIEKVGEAAAQTGTNMHELNGITTALVEATGLEGSEAGTSIRAVLSRTFGLGKDGADGKGMKALKEVGVDVRDTSGEFKSFNQILTEAHGKWNNLTKSQQMALAQGEGGVQHYSQFMTIMENWNTVIKATNTSINSQDSALNENQKYLESTAGKLGQLKTANQRLTSDFMSSNTTKGFIDFAKTVVNGTDSMVKTFGSIPTILGVASTALVGFNKNFKVLTNTSEGIGLSKNASGVLNNIKSGLDSTTSSWRKNYTELSFATQGYNKFTDLGNKAKATVQTLGNGMKSLTSSTMASTVATTALNAVIGMGIGLAIGAAITGIQKLMTYYSDLDSENKQLLQTQNDSIQGHQSNINQLEDMKTQYTEVEDRMNSMRANGLQPTIEDQNTMNSLNDKIAKMMPNLVEGYDSQGKAILNLKGNYDDLISTEKEAIKQDALKALNNAKDPKSVSEDKSKKIKAQMMGADDGNLFSSMESKIKSSEVNSGNVEVSTQKMAEYKKELEDVEQWYKPFLSDLILSNDAYGKLDPSLQKIVTDYTNIKGIFNNTSNFDEIEAKISIMSEALSKTDAQPLIKSIEELNAKAKSGTISTEDYSKKLSDFLTQLSSKTGIAKDQLQKMFNVDPSKLKKSVEDTLSSIDKMIKSVDDLQKDLSGNLEDINKYSKMLNEIKDKGIISEASQKEIITKDPELIPYLSNMGTLTTELTKKIDDLKIKSEGAFSAIKIQEEEKTLKTLLETYNELHERTDLNEADKKKLADAIEGLKGKVEGFTDVKGKDDNATKSNINLTNDRIRSLENEQKYLQLVAQSGKDKAKDMITAEITQTNITYQKEIDAYEKTGKATGKTFIGATVIGKTILENDMKQIDAAIVAGDKDATESAKQLDGTINTLSEDTGTNTKEKAANTAAQKELNEQVKQAELLTKQYDNTLKALDATLYKLNSDQQGMDETSQKYRDSLKSEIDLLKQKTSVTKDYISSNEKVSGSLLNTAGKNGGSQLGQQIVNTAESYIGTPYAWGGESPSGFDCSGLVQYVYQQVGTSLNRTSQDQFSQGTPVEKSQLQPGDLVFFKGSDGSADAPGHVAIYAGGGEIVEAPHKNATVRTASLDNRSDYVGARRIISGGSSSQSSSDTTTSSSSSSSNAVTAEQLDKILGGKLAGHGADYIKYGQQYGVDPALAASISTFETGHGSVLTHNNPAGIMDWDNNWSTLRNFSSLSEGIEYAIKNLKTEYIDKGLISVSSIGGKYSPVGAANDPNGTNKDWIPGVSSIYKQITGNDPSSLNYDSLINQAETLQGKTQDLQKTLTDYSRKILEDYTKIYESQIKLYDKQISSSDKQLELDKERFELYEKDSNSSNDSSRQYMQKEYEDINARYGVLTQKQKFIEGELKNNIYDEKTSTEIKQNLLDVQTEMEKTKVELHTAFKDWLTDRLTYKTQGFTDNIESSNSQLSLLNEKDSNGYSEEKVALNQQILEQERLKGEAIKEQARFIQDLYDKEQFGVTRQLWKKQLEDLKKTQIENQTEIEKSINTLRDAKISEILDDVDKRLKLINQDLKDIDNNSKDVGDNNTSQKLINEMNKAQDYVAQLKEYTKAYNDIYKTLSADGVISTDDQKKIDDARSKIDSVNDALQTTKLNINSLKLENAIAPFEQAIDKITNNFSKLDYQLNMLGSTDYSQKTNILSEQLGLNNTKTQSYLDEYKELMDQLATPGTKEAETLANKLSDVKTKLMDASKEGKTLKQELADASLSAIFEQIQKPKDKINQLQSNIEFQTSMPSEVQGLLLGNNFNIDTETDTEKQLEETQKITDAVDSIDSKISDLSSATLDIDTSSITSAFESTTNTTNDILKNINDSVNAIDEKNNKTVETKNVYGSGADLDNAKFSAQNYGIEKLFKFIDTNESGFLWSEHKVTKNDIALGGTGGGVNGDVELNGATRLPGKDRDDTRNLIDDYMKSLTAVLKDKSGNESTSENSEKSNEALLATLGAGNTNSSAIANNTAQDVTVTNIQTATLTKTEEDSVKSINDNINSNFVTLEELTRNIKDALTSIKDVISSIKELETTDLGQIIADLKVIDTKTIIQELINLHGSVNSLGETISIGLSNADKSISFNGTAAVTMPDYSGDNKNKKEADKKAYGNSKLDPSILGDGEGSNKGEELVIHKDGSAELIGKDGYTLVTDLSEDDTVLSHEDTKKVLSQGGVQKVSKYADGNKKVRVFAKSSPPDGDYENAYDYINNKLGRKDIEVVNIDDGGITSSDYVLGTELTIPNSMANGAKRIDGGAGREETYSNFINWVSWQKMQATKDDVNTVDNPTTKPVTLTTRTADNYNKVTSDSDSTSTVDTIDYTKLENTDYRKQINKDIIDSQNKYNNQLVNGASNVDLLKTEIELEEKKILLNNEGIKQLEERKKLTGLSAEDQSKINNEQISLNKELQESQKKINELAKEEVEAVTAVNDVKNKQLENSIKLIGSNNTKNELENDRRKIEILKSESQELKNQENSLKELTEKGEEYLNDLSGFSSSKLSNEDNMQIKDLISKQYKDGYLSTEDQSKLKTLEAKLTKLDPDQSLNLQKIIDLLISSRDKTTDTQINVVNLKEKIQEEEYNTALEIIENQKKLEEKKFEEQKKQWSKQIFYFSEDEFNQYKTNKISDLQKDKAAAQESLKNSTGEDQDYYLDEIKAKEEEIGNISNQNYSEIYDWESGFQKIHEERIKQIEEENKETEKKEASLKRTNDLLELQKQLNDALNNKSVQVMTKDKEGNWQFQYASDITKVQDIQKNINDKMKDNANTDRQEKIENEKQAENDLISVAKEHYEKLVNDQQHILTEKYSDMSYLAETYLQQIKAQVGGDDTKIQQTLGIALTDSQKALDAFILHVNTKVDEMAKKINELNLQVEKDKPNADTSTVVKEINDVASGKATKEEIQQLNDLLNNDNASPELQQFKKDLFDYSKINEVKEVLSKYLPSGTDVNKWLSDIQSQYNKNSSSVENTSTTPTAGNTTVTTPSVNGGMVTNTQANIDAYMSSDKYKDIQQEAVQATLRGNTAQSQAQLADVKQKAADLAAQYGVKLDTGGYTGDWGTKDGKLAWLHQKELVLKEDDTKNVLSAANILKNLKLPSLLNSIQLPTLNSKLPDLSGIAKQMSQPITNNHFDNIVLPNVTNGDEFVDQLNHIDTYMMQQNGI